MAYNINAIRKKVLKHFDKGHKSIEVCLPEITWRELQSLLDLGAEKKGFGFVEFKNK